VQDEIAQAIAAALEVKLAVRAERHKPSLPAYDAYLKYRHHIWGFTPDSLQRSRDCLEQAPVLDPQFALPYVGLADLHIGSAAVGAMTSHEAMPRARALAERALELDPNLPEAHAMLGIVAGHYDLNWKEAEQRFRKAMALEPISCHLRAWYAQLYLLSMGQAEEARRQMTRVLEEDPLSQIWHYLRSCHLAALELDEQALAAMRKSVELDPRFWLGCAFLGFLLADSGQYHEAREYADRAAAEAPWSPYSAGILAGALMRTGEKEKAEEWLARLRTDSNGAIGLTYFHLILGEIDSAAEWADKAIEQRFFGIVVTVAIFAPRLRRSPRWPALLKKVNL